MFDIGSMEMLVIAILAIVVIGPKELPTVLRTIGQYVAKAKGMAREFQMSLDEAARESELDALKKELEGAGNDIRRTVERDMVAPAEAATNDINRAAASLNQDLKASSEAKAAEAGSAESAEAETADDGLNEAALETEAGAGQPAQSPELSPNPDLSIDEQLAQAIPVQEPVAPNVDTTKAGNYDAPKP